LISSAGAGEVAGVADHDGDLARDGVGLGVVGAGHGVDEAAQVQLGREGREVVDAVELGALHALLLGGREEVRQVRLHLERLRGGRGRPVGLAAVGHEAADLDEHVARDLAVAGALLPHVLGVRRVESGGGKGYSALHQVEGELRRVVGVDLDGPVVKHHNVRFVQPVYDSGQ